jgi:hypothetical protein
VVFGESKEMPREKETKKRLHRDHRKILSKKTFLVVKSWRVLFSAIKKASTSQRIAWRRVVSSTKQNNQHSLNATAMMALQKSLGIFERFTGRSMP